MKSFLLRLLLLVLVIREHLGSRTTTRTPLLDEGALNLIADLIADYPKCSLVGAALREPRLAHGLNRRISKPNLNLDLTADEATLRSFGPRARYQLFCSVVLAEFGSPDDLAANHQKLLTVIKPLKTDLLIISLMGEVPWQQLKIFPAKTVLLQKVSAGGIMTFIICPNQDPTKHQLISTRPLLVTNPKNSSHVENIFNTFEKCPHPLHGKTVRVTSTGTNPYLYNDDKKRPILGPNGIPLGSNSGIALTLAKIYKFKLNLTVAEKPPFFNKTTGKWTENVQDIIEGALDLGMGDFQVVKTYLDFVDMSSYISMAEAMFTVCEPKEVVGWFNILRPFGLDLWMTVVAFVVVVGFVFAIIYQIYLKVSHPSLIRTKNKKILHFVQDSFGSLIQSEPPPNFKNEKCSCSAACMMIFVWNIMGMMLIFAYTCNLRTNLLFKPTETPMNTYQDIVERDLIVLMPKLGYALQERFRTSPYFIMRELHRLAVKNNGLYNYNNGVPTELIQSVLDCKATLFNSRILVRYAPRETDKFGRKIRLVVREIRENLYIAYTAIMFQKYSYLEKSVNKGLGVMKAAGLIQHFWNDPLYLEQTMNLDLFTFYDNSKDKLTMTTFTLIFAIYGIGAALSLICLAIENVVYRHEAAKKRKMRTRRILVRARA